MVGKKVDYVTAVVTVENGLIKLIVKITKHVAVLKNNVS
jgi:hypothetical protein